MQSLEFSVGEHKVICQESNERLAEDFEHIDHVSPYHFVVREGDKYTFNHLKESPEYLMKRSFIDFTLALAIRRPKNFSLLLESGNPIFYLDAHGSDNNGEAFYFDDISLRPLKEKVAGMSNYGARAAILKVCTPDDYVLEDPLIPVIYSEGKVAAFGTYSDLEMELARSEKDTVENLFTSERRDILGDFVTSLATFEKELEGESVNDPTPIWKMMRGKYFDIAKAGVSRLMASSRKPSEK